MVTFGVFSVSIRPLTCIADFAQVDWRGHVRHQYVLVNFTLWQMALAHHSCYWMSSIERLTIRCAVVNYWYHTGDSTWNDATAQAIYFQSDPSSGGFFDSNNVSFQLGNDDQAFWAFAAIEAAEYKFPNPPAGYPSWLAMVRGSKFVRGLPSY